MTPSPARLRPAWRALALLLIVTGWGVPLAFPHVADDDLLCAIAEAGGDTRTARIVESAASAPADHCEVCHSLRSFRHAGLPAAIASTGIAAARAVIPEFNPSADRVTPHRLPARAPPA